MVKKSIDRTLLIVNYWKFFKIIFYKKFFTNWNNIYLSWFFLKTNIQLNFSLEYFISLTLDYLDNTESEHNACEKEEKGNLFLSYSLLLALPTIKFLAFIFKVSLSRKFINVGFTLVQRMFFKIAVLYRYWGYLTRKIIHIKETNLFQPILESNQFSLRYLCVTSYRAKTRLTLFFYNFNKAFFKKFLSLRQVLWTINTRGTRTKRRYKKFCNFRLKKQNTMESYQLLFYILRQLEVVYSWEHLTILLYYSLISLNRRNTNLNTLPKQGDILECYFGSLLDEYYNDINYLIGKYKLMLQHKLYKHNSINLKIFIKQNRLPYFIKILPYMQLGTTVGYTIDYTLNTILITYIPLIPSLASLPYYYNLSLFYLSIWRYNV